MTVVKYHARADVLGGIDLPVHLYRAVREELHNALYHLLFDPQIVPTLSGDTVNIELEILAGRVKYAAFDQHRRLVPLIIAFFYAFGNIKAIVEARPVYDHLRLIFQQAGHRKREVELAAVEKNARLRISLFPRQLICPDYAVEGAALDRELRIAQQQRRRHILNLPHTGIAPVPAVRAVDRAAVDRDLRALTALERNKIVVADAAVVSIDIRIYRIQPCQRAAVHCEFGRRASTVGAYHDDAVPLGVPRKFNLDRAAALAVVQREFAGANCDQVVKLRPLACVDPDLMAVQVQFLAFLYNDRIIIISRRIIDVIFQREIS
ncbi:hypothetical protein [Flavonifractor sp. HCP28S3_F3]|uniref:hypothetical protein n=1 Tax=Flavonifractor sp. HCP28S3_F3 TaxID=3438939 RepID=UPI003F8B824E